MDNLIPESVQYLLQQFKFETLNENFKCTYCQKLITNAYQAFCGCSYCYECIFSYLRDKSNFCKGNKEDCKKQLLVIEGNIFKNAYLNNKILEANVFCPNQFCRFTTQLHLMDEHLRVCTKTPIECPYFQMGCNDGISSKEAIQTHMNTETLIHTQLLMEWINNLKNDVDASKLEIASLKDTCRDNEINLNEQKREVERLRVDSREKEMKIARLEIESDEKKKSIFVIKKELEIKEERIFNLEMECKRFTGRSITPTVYELIHNYINIKYNCTTDTYTRPSDCGLESLSSSLYIAKRKVKSTDSPNRDLAKDTENWKVLVASWTNIKRNIEYDWKMVYLARTPGCNPTDIGELKWIIDLYGTNKVLGEVTVSVKSEEFHSASVKWQISADDQEIPFTGSITTTQLVGRTNLTLTAVLAGGPMSTGRYGWQHAQLFRQAITDFEGIMLEICVNLQDQ